MKYSIILKLKRIKKVFITLAIILIAASATIYLTAAKAPKPDTKLIPAYQGAMVDNSGDIVRFIPSTCPNMHMSSIKVIGATTGVTFTK